MPPIQAGLKGNKDPTSWADQMENEDDESLLLPPKTEVCSPANFVDNLLIVTKNLLIYIGNHWRHEKSDRI